MKQKKMTKKNQNKKREKKQSIFGGISFIIISSIIYFSYITLMFLIGKINPAMNNFEIILHCLIAPLIIWIIVYTITYLIYTIMENRKK
jgi:uncharacterized BrkB/YihY/UPF0761 family membrane protein